MSMSRMPQTARDRRATLVFFALAFGLPWAGWSWMQVLAASASPPEWWTRLFYAGTTIVFAGLAAAWAAGPEELRRLLRECVRVDAGLLAWALVLFVPILWVAVSVGLYAATHGGFGRVELSGWWGVMTRPEGWINLSYPVTEEIAWRGFLLPHLMKRRSALVSALLVGVIWAVWHVPFYWTRLKEDPAWLVSFSLGVVCLSLIFAFVYLKGRSVLLPMLLHWHVNAIQDAVQPTFPDLPTLGRIDAFGLTFTAVIMAIAAVFAVLLRRSDRRASTEPPVVVPA